MWSVFTKPASEDVAVVLRARGGWTMVLGGVLMAAWVVLVFYAKWPGSPWLTNALLWAGEILFFWGLLQYVLDNLRRFYRQSRLGDRRIERPGRRIDDLAADRERGRAT